MDDSTRENTDLLERNAAEAKSSGAGPNPNTALLAYAGEETAEGQPNHSLQLQKATYRRQILTLLTDGNRTGVKSQKLQQEKF